MAEKYGSDRLEKALAEKVTAEANLGITFDSASNSIIIEKPYYQMDLNVLEHSDQLLTELLNIASKRDISTQQIKLVLEMARSHKNS